MLRDDKFHVSFTAIVVVCILMNRRKMISWVRNFRRLIKTREKAMVPHSSTLAGKIPWTEEPGGLPSLGLHRVGHD